MRIALVEEDLPHYRVPIFNALDDMLDSKLTVFHGEELSGEGHIILDPNKIPFSEQKIQLIELFRGKLYFSNPIIFKRLLNYDVVLMRGNIRNLLLIPIIKFLKFNNIPVILWGQGYSRRREFQPEENFIDKVYLYLVKLVDAYVCYTDEIKDVLSRYAYPDKLFVANNTLSSKKITKYRDRLENKGKRNLRRELGFNKRHYISFIGRIKKRKKVGYLLDVYKLLKKELDIGLILIGEGEEKVKLADRVKNENIQDVVLMGSLINFEAAKYLYATDLLVIPGWLGLAVNHALLLGLPVISQKEGDNLVGHPPEAKHIVDGCNGFFSEYNKPKAMKDDIIKVLNNKSEFSKNAARYADNHLNLEKMLNGFKEAVNHVMRS